MAMLNVLVDRGPAAVWDVLADGWAYGEWVMGAQQTCDVDPRWPEVGSALRYTAGFGPLTYQDVTTVRLVEPGRHLELEAHAGRLGTARISIELLPWGDDRTVVILDEHPLTGPGARWHSVAVEVLPPAPPGRDFTPYRTGARCTCRESLPQTTYRIPVAPPGTADGARAGRRAGRKAR